MPSCYGVRFAWEASISQPDREPCDAEAFWRIRPAPDGLPGEPWYACHEHLTQVVCVLGEDYPQAPLILTRI